MKKKLLRGCRILLPVAAALLSAMPNVVKMNWMGGTASYESAFSMIPVGYAVWGPFLAAMGAVVLTVLSVVTAIRKNRGLENAMFVISILGALCGLSAAIFGNLTALGALISLLLALEGVVVRRMRK